jgi:hypothetical protein
MGGVHMPLCVWVAPQLHAFLPRHMYLYAFTTSVVRYCGFSQQRPQPSGVVLVHRAHSSLLLDTSQLSECPQGRTASASQWLLLKGHTSAPSECVCTVLCTCLTTVTCTTTILCKVLGLGLSLNQHMHVWCEILCMRIAITATVRLGRKVQSNLVGKAWEVQEHPKQVSEHSTCSSQFVLAGLTAITTTTTTTSTTTTKLGQGHA